MKNGKMFNEIDGFKIVTNIHMTIDHKYNIKRTWKERLFTLPWKPLQKTRVIIMQVPSTEVIVNGNTLIMHPEIAKELKNQMNNEFKE